MTGASLPSPSATGSGAAPAVQFMISGISRNEPPETFSFSLALPMHECGAHDVHSLFPFVNRFKNIVTTAPQLTYIQLRPQ